MTLLKPRFTGGSVYATPGILDTIDPAHVDDALTRHFGGDWGDCGEEDRKANEEALEEGSRLFSVYHDRTGAKFWIITEADRTSTTVLLPDEY